jgi:hypothetical protein
MALPAGDWFGDSVAVTDRMVVIGAYRHNDGVSRVTGAVYVFEMNNAGQDEQVSMLVANDATNYDSFGHPVAAINGLVVVGASGDDDTALGVGAENPDDDVFGRCIEQHWSVRASAQVGGQRWCCR